MKGNLLHPCLGGVGSPSPRPKPKNTKSATPTSPSKQARSSLSLISIRKLRETAAGQDMSTTNSEAPATSSDSETEMLGFDNDSEPLESSTPSRPDNKPSPGVKKSKIKANNSSNRSKTGGSTSSYARIPSLFNEGESRDQTVSELIPERSAEESCYQPSRPELISQDGSTSLYFNPNPAKSRSAHIKPEIRAVPPVRTSKPPPSPSTKEKKAVKPRRVENNTAELIKPGKAELVPGASARARLLNSGFKIEVIVLL